MIRTLAYPTLILALIALPLIATPPAPITTSSLRVDKHACIKHLQACTATISSLDLLDTTNFTNLPCNCSVFDTLTVSSLDILDTTNLTNLPCSCSAFDTLTVSSLDILDPTNLTNLPCACSSFDTLMTSSLDVTDGATIGCSLSVGCNISLVDSTDTQHGNIIKGGAPFIHNYPTTGGDTNLFIGTNAGNFNAHNTTTNSIGIGTATLATITSGFANTALGTNTLTNATQASYNTALGTNALSALTTGNDNTALGFNALATATTPSDNTALGYAALSATTTGSANIAIGSQSATNITTGTNNIALGIFSLGSTALTTLTGSNNIAIGYEAGTNITTGSNNIIIDNFNSGNLITGSSNIYIYKDPTLLLDESNTIRIGNFNQSNAYIAGIYSTILSTGIDVVITSDGHLGTLTSSARFKDNIAALTTEPDRLRTLRPVQFTYRNCNHLQYGLIAEEVAAIYPELVAYDDDGQPYTVRYTALIPLLIHAHQQYSATVDALHVQVEHLTATIQHLIARIALLEQKASPS